jgi:arylsulfatase A-like enzyme
MASEPRNRKTIIVRVGLLGASAGIVLGLIEAACLRLTDLPLPASIWFFAPVLTTVAFGWLGLVMGFLASLPRSRFLGMVIIASLAGLAGDYLALVLRYSRSAPGLQHVATPAILFAGFCAWTLAALWATRKPDCSLGFLADVPKRLWSRVVFASMAVLVVTVGISQLPDYFASSAAHATGTASSPNIVLILWDTTRADHLSSYGYFRNTTPNVDRLAKRGVLFENAIAASSWTLPATASIFTSLLPHQHGADTDRASEPRTLAEVLRSVGYETAGFNANPYYGIIPWGLGRGFETYIDSTRSMGYSLDASRIGGEIIEPLTEEWFHRRRFNQFTAHELNEQVYRWFDHRSDRPFFLFLNYNDAHEPYEAALPHNHLYGHASENAKHLLLTASFGRFYLPPGERERVIADYDNCLNYMDGQMADLLRFLERSPAWSNTYVIITADHGEAFGEHDTYTHGWNLYREVLHVPLVIAGPGIPQGVRIRDIARTPQIFATVLEMAGMKSPVLRRNSLMRLENPDYAARNPPDPIVSEMVDPTPFSGPQGMISITTQEWQLIYRAGHQHSSLYHWPTDPLEKQNLADMPANQAVVEELKANLLSIIWRSYRPWRGTNYLPAFFGFDFSPNLQAVNSIPAPRGGPFLPHGPGAEQTLFAPNRKTPQSDSRKADRDLLESLPYDAR